MLFLFKEPFLKKALFWYPLGYEKEKDSYYRNCRGTR